MSEVDERRIAELAKEPPRVLRGVAGPGALVEARKLLEQQALMNCEQREGSTPEDSGG
ncbi:hypothetical protein [Streptomyces sp. NPDC054765]